MTTPQEEGWQWWEEERGLPHGHLCCCCDAPKGNSRREQRGQEISMGQQQFLVIYNGA